MYLYLTRTLLNLTYMKTTLSTIIFLIISPFYFSQISYEKRIEFELKDGYYNERITEFKEKGFLMNSRKIQSINNETEWKYDLYNTNLEQVKTKKLLLNKKYFKNETFSDNERLYTLFTNKKGEYQLITINASNLEEIQVSGLIPKKSYVKSMAILGDYAYLKTIIKKSPFLFAINWKTGEKKLIPVSIKDYSSKRLTLMNFQILKESNEIFLYVKALIKNKISDIYVIRLNDRGEKEEVFNFTENIDKNIIDISGSKISNNRYIFTGTYSSKSTALSEGLFFCKSEKSKIDFIKFYNFLDLENFLSYLPERKQKKIEKKKNKKEKKGKEMRFNYRIAAHGLIQLNDGYLFLGEAFYPTYRMESYQTTVNGVTTTQYRQVFDGYQYTHAILGKFNKKGELIWDQIFELYGTYKPFYVKRFISIAEQKQNSINLVFSSRNKIYSKSFDFNGSVLKEKESDKIETNFSGDKTKRTFSNIDFWYDKYFLAYGSQKIINKEKENNVKRKRKVYFISKIKYE